MKCAADEARRERIAGSKSCATILNLTPPPAKFSNAA